LRYSLNDLQKDANRRLGLAARQTPDAAHTHCDQHLASYLRMEARVITIASQSLARGEAHGRHQGFYE
jgi:DNA topoisomerase IA